VQVPTKKLFVNIFYNYNKDNRANQSYVMDAYRRYSL